MNDEDGAIAVMVGILLVVLLGFGALVIDVGNLYDERRQLQNGADAAALALAAECAEGTLDCAAATTVFAGAAQPYADANARDDAAGVPTIMSHGADPSICDPGGDSAPNPLTDTGTVKVSTETVNANTGARFVTHWFAGLIGTQTTTVTACAVAAMGGIGGGVTIPIAACDKAWNNITNFGNTLPSPTEIWRIGANPGGTPDPDLACLNPGTGETYSGGFGYLDADGNCQAVVEVEGPEDGWTDGNSGNNPDITGSSPCDPFAFYSMLKNLVDSGDTALVPIFDYHTGNGSNGRFHVIGFGAFTLEGYRINGGPAPGGGLTRSYNLSASECGPSQSCLKVSFTNFVTLDAVPSGGGSTYGTTLIGLTN